MTEDTAPRKRGTTSLVVGVALFALGALWLLAALDVELDVPWATVLAASCLALGLVQLATARSGPHWGLVIIGLLLVPVATAAVTLPEIPEGGVGERVIVVDDPGDLEGEFEHGVGEFTIDLRELDAADGERFDLEVSQAVGELRIEVPDNVDVRMRAEVGIGEAAIRGPGGFDGESEADSVAGIGVEDELRSEVSSADGELWIEASMGVGSIVVVR